MWSIFNKNLGDFQGDRLLLAKIPDILDDAGDFSPPRGESSPREGVRLA